MVFGIIFHIGYQYIAVPTFGLGIKPRGPSILPNFRKDTWTWIPVKEKPHGLHIGIVKQIAQDPQKNERLFFSMLVDDLLRHLKLTPQFGIRLIVNQS